METCKMAKEMHSRDCMLWCNRWIDNYSVRSSHVQHSYFFLDVWCLQLSAITNLKAFCYKNLPEASNLCFRGGSSQHCLFLEQAPALRLHKRAAAAQDTPGPCHLSTFLFLQHRSSETGGPTRRRPHDRAARRGLASRGTFERRTPPRWQPPGRRGPSVNARAFHHPLPRLPTARGRRPQPAARPGGAWRHGRGCWEVSPSPMLTSHWREWGDLLPVCGHTSHGGGLAGS